MYAKIPVKNISREEWLKLRKTGIGGSDAGSICGMNPYSNAMKAYRDKICDTVKEQDNKAIRQGRDLEEYAVQRFMEEKCAVLILCIGIWIILL